VDILLYCPRSALTLPPLLSRREARLWGIGEGNNGY